MDKRYLVIFFFLSISFCLMACHGSSEKDQQNKVAIPDQRIDYIKAIPGENDTIAAPIKQRGEVLIAYSDCYTCHALDTRSKGPAFKDIARRYPIQQVYIDMLAQKVIVGGSGAWGDPVMSSHANLPVEDAKMMVSYILSLKE